MAHIDDSHLTRGKFLVDVLAQDGTIWDERRWEFVASLVFTPPVLTSNTAWQKKLSSQIMY